MGQSKTLQSGKHASAILEDRDKQPRKINARQMGWEYGHAPPFGPIRHSQRKVNRFKEGQEELLLRQKTDDDPAENRVFIDQRTKRLIKLCLYQ